MKTIFININAVRPNTFRCKEIKKTLCLKGCSVNAVETLRSLKNFHIGKEKRTAK